MRHQLVLAVVLATCLAVVVPPMQSSVVKCMLCKMAVHVVSPILDGAEKIEQELGKKCKESKIPFISLECENFIEKHLDPIVEELESATTEEDVCKKIHEC